jgi:hypothetical protein
MVTWIDYSTHVGVYYLQGMDMSMNGGSGLQFLLFAEAGSGWKTR